MRICGNEPQAGGMSDPASGRSAIQNLRCIRSLATFFRKLGMDTLQPREVLTAGCRSRSGGESAALGNAVLAGVSSILRKDSNYLLPLCPGYVLADGGATTLPGSAWKRVSTS